MRLEAKHQFEFNRKEAVHTEETAGLKKMHFVARPDYRQSQFPVAQNKRHFP